LELQLNTRIKPLEGPSTFDSTLITANVSLNKQHVSDSLYVAGLEQMASSCNSAVRLDQAMLKPPARSKHKPFKD